MNTPLGLQAVNAAGAANVAGNAQSHSAIHASDIAQTLQEPLVFADCMVPALSTADLPDVDTDEPMAFEEAQPQEIAAAGSVLTDAELLLSAMQPHWVSAQGPLRAQQLTTPTMAKPTQVADSLSPVGAQQAQAWTTAANAEPAFAAKAIQTEVKVSVFGADRDAALGGDFGDPSVQSDVRVAQPLNDAAASAARNAMPVPAPLSVRQPQQALMQALAQRVQVQQSEGVDVATVRLDPPQMGSLEIRIRQDANGVHVQFQASNAEVGRQLANLAEGLRQELQQRHQDASVSVAQSRFTQSNGQHSQQRDQQAAHAQEPEIGQALQA